MTYSDVPYTQRELNGIIFRIAGLVYPYRMYEKRYSKKGVEEAQTLLDNFIHKIIDRPSHWVTPDTDYERD